MAWRADSDVSSDGFLDDCSIIINMHLRKDLLSQFRWIEGAKEGRVDDVGTPEEGETVFGRFMGWK